MIVFHNSYDYVVTTQIQWSKSYVIIYWALIILPLLTQFGLQCNINLVPFTLNLSYNLADLPSFYYEEDFTKNKSERSTFANSDSAKKQHEPILFPQKSVTTQKTRNQFPHFSEMRMILFSFFVKNIQV